MNLLVRAAVAFLLVFNAVIRADDAKNNEKPKSAVIFGITGQDGCYLAQLLLEKGYIVHGVIRRASTFNTARIDHLYNSTYAAEKRFILHHGDLTDSSNIIHILEQAQPDEIYNLAAQSHVKVSFELPEYTANVDGMGALRILEAVRILGMINKTRFYQASSSEMFGKVVETPQTEKTPFYPRSPYGAAKVFAYWITVNYREAYGMFACNGILFNHESPERGETFVTRKVTRAIARIVRGKQARLSLGNLDSKRDWGYAKDYVEAMWLMLQQERPADYVVATGQTYTVREFVERAFAYAGIELAWRGSGLDEVGYDKHSGKEYVFVDSRYFRPTEVDLLLGDASFAKKQLGWEPRTSFDGLVKIMMDADFSRLDRHD